MTVALVVLLAFLVTITLMLVLRPVAMALGMVDEPGGRKRHSGVIPITGGIAMFMGVVFAVATVGDWGQNGATLIIAATLMVLVGVLDDNVELHPLARLLAQVVAATVLVFGTRYAVSDLGDLFGMSEVALGPMAVPFTIVAAVALINAFNMLDGMDGLAGSVALVGAIGLALYAVPAGAIGSTAIASGLIGACAGFLIFNLPAGFNRSLRAFMGDSGSTFLGFTFCGLALVLVQPDKADLPPVVVLWLLPIPIFELFTSTARRVIRGISPMVADDNHFHHRLLNAGFSVRLIFTIYVVLSVFSVTVGTGMHWAGAPESAMFLMFIAFYAGWLLFVRLAHRITVLLPLSLRRDLENLVH